jgi:hypothetical protein
MKRLSIARTGVAAVLGLVLAAAGAQPQAQPAEPAQPQQAQARPPDTQALARDLLMRMARYVSQAPRFSVEILSSYDTVQESGQQIEFAERRNVVVNRPAQLSVVTERSDGSRSETVFTGKDIELIDTNNKVYAREPQPGGIDESVVHLVSDLGVRLPLAVLLMNRMPAELERRVRSVDYVEKTNLLGTPSHHLAVRGDTVDFQVWVADGAQPVPLRIVINYRNEPGQPQFRAMLNNWNFAPAITAATFTPEVPAGARQIAFATQIAAGAKGANKTAIARGGK